MGVRTVADVTRLLTMSIYSLRSAGFQRVSNVPTCYTADFASSGSGNCDRVKVLRGLQAEALRYSPDMSGETCANSRKEPFKKSDASDEAKAQATTLFRVEKPICCTPRVARPSQPWALLRNPFGIQRSAGGRSPLC